MKVILLAGSAMLLGGFFQLPSTPPMKLGLWESTSTTQMTMPGMDMPPRTTKAQICYTADSWAKTLAQSGRSDCSVTNQSFSGNGYSADISCPKSGSKGHISSTWSSHESGEGKMHMEMNNAGHSGTVDVTTTSHFVSSDCGAVKPGMTVPVQ